MSVQRIRPVTKAAKLPQTHGQDLRLTGWQFRGRLWLSIICALLVFGCVAKGSDTAPMRGWVVIPVSEYARLYSRAFPLPSEPPPSPVPACLTRVDYDLRIDSALAVGRATLTLDALQDAWSAVPIPAGLRIREAMLDGKPATLVPPAGGQTEPWSILLAKRGRSVLTLEVAVPVALISGEEALSLPASSSGVTRASITIARQDVQIGVTGGVLTENTDSPTEDRWTAYARANETLTFTWRRKIEDRHVNLPLRLRGSLVQMVGLGEDSTAISAEANLQVVQGEARQVRIQVPDSITVNQVQGATVADWQVKGGELLVTFLEPVEESTIFVINGEARLPKEGRVEVPLLRLLDIERDSGGVAVDVLGAGEIRETQPQGLEPALAAELGQMVSSRQSPSLVAFRVRSVPSNGPQSLMVQVARYAQQAVLTANVEEARYHVLMSGEGKTLVMARYAVRNNQRNFVHMSLPAGSMLWSAALAGRQAHPGQAPDGSLLFPLAKAKSGEEAPAFSIEVLYLVRGNVWAEKGQVRLVLPVLDLPVSRTGLVLYHPPGFRLTALPGAFRGETYQKPISAVLSGGSVVQPEEAVAAPAPGLADVSRQSVAGRSVAALQTLVNRYNEAYAARTAVVMAAGSVTFPIVGPSLYFVSELTAENQAPALEFGYEREKKGGRR